MPKLQRTDEDYAVAIAEIRERERVAFAAEPKSMVGLLLAEAKLHLELHLERLRRGLGRPQK